MSVEEALSNYGKIAGPLLLGYLLSWGLYGVLCVQIYSYHASFSKDRLWIKSIVYGDFFLETLQTVLFTESAFRTYAAGFGNINRLDEVHTIWLSACVLTGMVAFISQAFYAHRIYKLSGKPYVAVVVLSLSVIQLVGAIISGIKLMEVGRFSEYSPKLESYVLGGIWQGTSAVCDVIIAASIFKDLSSRKSLGAPDTQNLIARLIRITVGSGTLTALTAVVSFSCNFLPGTPPYFQTAVCTMAKLYSNSMMVVLNNRGVTPRSTSLHNDSTKMDFCTIIYNGSAAMQTQTLSMDRDSRILEISRGSSTSPTIQDSKTTTEHV